MSTPEENDVADVVRELGDLLPGKVRAYGAAHNRQPGMWHAILADYRNPDGSYTLPHALIAHMPRITRVFDRMCRIVASPEVDLLGENPWLDAAGDCVAGAAMGRKRTFDARGPLPQGLANRDSIEVTFGTPPPPPTDEECIATAIADEEREEMERHARYTHGAPEDPDA